MSLDNVVFTYDPSMESFEEYVENNGVTFGALTQEEKARLNQEFVRAFRDRGAEVTTFSHRDGDIPSAVEEVRSAAEDADLIFHDFGWVGMNADSREWEQEYTEEVERMIEDNFLHKTHFSGKENNYTDKRKTVEIAEQAGIPVPDTWSVEQQLEGEGEIPAVMKAREGSQGSQVYFFDREGQAETFWNPENYEGLGETGFDAPMPDTEDYFFQEFVDTPDPYNSHYRIIATGNGEVVGAVLSASPDTGTRINQGELGPGKNIYHCEDSPLFLNMRDIMSNKAQGGTQIPLGSNQGARDKDVHDHRALDAHGIDVFDPSLPDELRKEAERTAEVFGEYGVAYSGQDWVQDEDGDFYLLEVNKGPGMKAFNQLYNHGREDPQRAKEIGTYKIAEALDK